MFHLRAEMPADAPAIEQLLDRAFGPDRTAKASYAFRDGVSAEPGLARVAVALEDGRVVGTIRYWPVAVGDDAALLLGPLGVEPVLKGRGIGRALVRHALDRARRTGLWGAMLTTDRHVPFNRGFYEALGFATCRESTPPVLADTLAREIALGLDPDRRIAMVMQFV